ncbi:TIGR00159 family protein [Microvenator marinus]|uniref:Diadenylate cyclase n=1 Tax=Microvenator marinus TaxID=2600177 RepID=A0A5B8XSG0_9DELT|nr:diadenylate cyclase CdaA [Microvenator marinus]QED26566.1 TIGR00159 family protein [Microvenator marinus]
MAFLDDILAGVHLGLFWAVVDFALVFFVIYKILHLIKGTRALQILGGLTLMVVMYFISKNSLITLETTHWFIDKFIANIFLIAVVIFQDDIRRALARFGKRTSVSFFSSNRAIEEASVLEEVIKACSQLQQQKLGALIAVERIANLDEITEDGVKLDAAVTKDLLFSLFIPDRQNPLHDGAVVIQKGRISAAGCFLPLTNLPNLEKSMGTRHRAALGLSGVTDAAICIVSEESGHISIAHRDQLYRDLDTNEMRDLLQRIFSPEGRNDESLVERFRRNDENEEPVT